MLVLGGGLLVRLLHWLAVGGEDFFARLALDSVEYDRWARAIAAGDWLGRDLGTFFQAPLYPYFLAVIYRFVSPSVQAVYGLQILLALVGCWMLYRAGSALAGPRHGLVAAWLAALYPVFVVTDVQVAKESLAVTVVAGLLWALVVAWRDGSVRAFLLAGVASGVLALLRENMLLVLPFFLPLVSREWWRPHTWWSRAPWLRLLALAGGVLLVLGPVAVRNGLVGGSFLPTTFQGGTNFYIGNNPTADGTYQPIVAGKQIPFYERTEPTRLAEEALGRSLSGAEVSRFWLGKSLAWARAEPAAFFALQLRKLALFWSPYEWPDAIDYAWVRTRSPILRILPFELAGVFVLALAGLWVRRRSLLGADLPVVLFVVGWMVATVIFFLFSRYRLPVVPALLLWAAAPVLALADALRRRGLGRAVGWGGLLVLAVVVSRLTLAEPRFDLVWYNQAVIHLQHGELDQARDRLEATLELSPNDHMVWLNLGIATGRGGDLPAALLALERAVELAPNSDDAAATLGAARLAARDETGARLALDRALALNARNSAAIQNRLLLARRSGEVELAAELEARLRLLVDPADPARSRG